MNVSLYSKPVCVQRKETMRAFDKAGVKYEEIDLSQDEKALAKVKNLGYMQAPVVIAGADHGGDFRLNKINEIAQR